MQIYHHLWNCHDQTRSVSIRNPPVTTHMWHHTTAIPPPHTITRLASRYDIHTGDVFHDDTRRLCLGTIDCCDTPRRWGCFKIHPPKAEDIRWLWFFPNEDAWNSWRFFPKEHVKDANVSHYLPRQPLDIFWFRSHWFWSIGLWAPLSPWGRQMILNEMSLPLSLIHSTLVWGWWCRFHGRFVEMPGVLPVRMPFKPKKQCQSVLLSVSMTHGVSMTHASPFELNNA